MWDRIVFRVNRLRERLWVRPLTFCLLSVVAALLARFANGLEIADQLPAINPDSIKILLSITASSMLVIATLAVASMVSAYASAASTATPRAFSLLISDDVSKNALSIFMGAFIYTFVSLVALENGFYQRGGNFVLFILTIAVLAWVILTFVRWVDWIARLGRIGTTVDKVEEATMSALCNRRLLPSLGGAAATNDVTQGTPVFATKIGYVQHVNMSALQACAEAQETRVTVSAIPGAFASPGRPLLHLEESDINESEVDLGPMRDAFELGKKRVYDSDPRFGLIALSEIASRALSPAVNDPGTAIEIMGSFVRLFSEFTQPLEEDENTEAKYDRVFVPLLSGRELLDDSFRPIVRDGAGIVELQVRVQKTLQSIASMGDKNLANAAKQMSRSALRRSELDMSFKHDIEAVASAARWSADD
ncbi:MAG: DUF2254 domain-containing protein [Woeseia sp.]|nr:DUF2254 domain-containing protein [Woeseia sp.]MBT8097632.1 DUF2254 domain-containing protein [Woeseia sp.]NNE62010.1 DUF2254 domain-containing protein [Woeseia sp.]NNL55887.1 DUF2254 domain-containing protein [Woeseia sp.]